MAWRIYGKPISNSPLKSVVKAKWFAVRQFCSWGREKLGITPENWTPWRRGNTMPQTSCPLSAFCSVVRNEGEKAQLCVDDQNIPSMRVQERHMPLPINHQRGKVFIRSVWFCGKCALLALKPKDQYSSPHSLILWGKTEWAHRV